MNDHGLNALIDSAGGALRNVWRRRRLALFAGWATAALGVAAIQFVPERYEATARVYVDTQSVLKPLMAGLAYQPDIDQQLRMLARTVISRPNVEKLLDLPDIAMPSATPLEREMSVSRLMNQIKLTAVDPGNLYTISYRDTVPERAGHIVEATVDMFVHSSSGEKKRDSEEASKFIEDQIKSYEVKLVEAENRVKDFKVRNFGVSGVSNQDYFARMSAMSDGVNKLRADLRAAEQSRDAYRRELAAEDPQLPATSEAEVAIAAQKKQLEELLRRFTDQHPDVVHARDVLQQLEAQKRRDASQRLADGGRSSGGATSPIYQRIRIELAEAEAQVGSLRSRVAAEQQRLDEVRSLAGRVPQVEAELAQLNRDYDVIRKNYDQLVTRRESASLGVKLDQSAQLTDFRLVEPPRVSPTPVFPGHVALAAIAIVGSIIAGIAAPMVAGALRPTYDDSKSLRLATGRPVLGTVSLSAAGGMARAQRGAKWGFGFGLALLLLGQCGWVAWLVTHPLAHSLI